MTWWGCESKNALLTVLYRRGVIEGGVLAALVAYTRSSAQQGSTVDSFTVLYSLALA